MDFINFKVGQKTVALKILDILLTEQYEENLTQLPNDNKSFLGIKDFMGKPVPVFDLGIILNRISTRETNNELINLLRDREQDHVDWLHELKLSIEQGTPFTKARDPHKCAFGRWYDHYKSENDDFNEILQKFDEPHKKLHGLADIVLDMVKANQQQEAQDTFHREERSTYARLIRLFESAREQLSLDYKPIIVFTTKDGFTPNIGLLVDKVEDSVTVAESDIQPLDELVKVGFDIDKQTKKLMRGLIRHKEKHSLILDPTAIFLNMSEEEIQASIESEENESLENVG
ncbi:chemotaxis protein CheW [Enterovibrio paralichthyis]|uniref:chemotaxis protein CheW n=1 Tax=Enterovibrio paralichthyis TaxID=2853805 RepID=UPI0006D02D08|nr:chemotaxis protein CheW [Enterovibrio paralichthyis]MBV7299938.1 chemotaxis protein CheW [Enterovibrio paralichthyis]